MSIRMMSAVWSTSKATGSDLLVELALADFANDDGVCWPSVAVIGEKARLRERAVFYALKWLVQLGELRVVETGRGTQHGSTYQLLPGGHEVPPVRPRNGTPDAPAPGPSQGAPPVDNRGEVQTVHRLPAKRAPSIKVQTVQEGGARTCRTVLHEGAGLSLTVIKPLKTKKLLKLNAVGTRYGSHAVCNDHAPPRRPLYSFTRAERPRPRYVPSIAQAKAVLASLQRRDGRTFYQSSS